MIKHLFAPLSSSSPVALLSLINTLQIRGVSHPVRLWNDNVLRLQWLKKHKCSWTADQFCKKTTHIPLYCAPAMQNKDSMRRSSYLRILITAVVALDVTTDAWVV